MIGMESISELVWLYVKRRPFLKEILRERIANYSALARKISHEAFGSQKKQNAVKMALVRLSDKLVDKEENLEAKILRTLKRSSISIRSKVSVIISSRELEGIHYLSYVESKGVITYMVEEKELEKLEIAKIRSIVRTESNLNLISVHSPPDLEEVPGVLAHMLNALAGEGINIVEFVSCYTDTLLVVKQADTVRAYELLSLLTG
jgi:aspartokinase